MVDGDKSNSSQVGHMSFGELLDKADGASLSESSLPKIDSPGSQFQEASNSPIQSARSRDLLLPNSSISSSEISSSASTPPPFRPPEIPPRVDSVGPPPITSISSKGQTGSILPERPVEPQLFKGVSSNSALREWQPGLESSVKSSTKPPVESTSNGIKSLNAGPANVFDAWREADLAKTRSSDSKAITSSLENSVPKPDRSELRRNFSDSGIAGSKVVAETYRIREDSAGTSSAHQKSSFISSPSGRQSETISNSISNHSLSEGQPKSVFKSGSGLVASAGESAEHATRVGSGSRIDSSIYGNQPGKIGDGSKQDLGQTSKELHQASNAIRSELGKGGHSDSADKRVSSPGNGMSAGNGDGKVNSAVKLESAHQAGGPDSKSGDVRGASGNTRSGSSGVIGLIHDLKPDFNLGNRNRADQIVSNIKDKVQGAIDAGGIAPVGRREKTSFEADKGKRASDVFELSAKASWVGKFYIAYISPSKDKNIKSGSVKNESLMAGGAKADGVHGGRPLNRQVAKLNGESVNVAPGGRDGRRSIFQILDGYLSRKNSRAPSEHPNSQLSDLDRYPSKSEKPKPPSSKVGDLSYSPAAPQRVGDLSNAPSASQKNGDRPKQASSPLKTGDLPTRLAKSPECHHDTVHPSQEVGKTPDKISPPKDATRIPAMLAGDYYPESFSIVVRKVKVRDGRKISDAHSGSTYPTSAHSGSARSKSTCPEITQIEPPHSGSETLEPIGLESRLPESGKSKLGQLITRRYIVLQGFNALSRRKRRKGLFRSLALRLGEVAYLTTDLLHRSTVFLQSTEPVSSTLSTSADIPHSSGELLSQDDFSSHAGDGTEIPVPDSQHIPEFLQQMTKALPPVVRLHLPGNSYSRSEFSGNSSKKVQQVDSPVTNPRTSDSAGKSSLIEQAANVAKNAKKEAGFCWGDRRGEPAEAINEKEGKGEYAGRIDSRVRNDTENGNRDGTRAPGTRRYEQSEKREQAEKLDQWEKPEQSKPFAEKEHPWGRYQPGSLRQLSGAGELAAKAHIKEETQASAEAVSGRSDNLGRTRRDNLKQDSIQQDNTQYGALSGGTFSMTEKWQKTKASGENAEVADPSSESSSDSSSESNSQESSKLKARRNGQYGDADDEADADCRKKDGNGNRVSKDSIRHISIFEEASDDPQASTVELSSIPETPAIARINPSLFSSSGRSSRRYANPDLDDQDETLISAYEDDTEVGGQPNCNLSGTGSSASLGTNSENRKSNGAGGIVEAMAKAVRVSAGEPGFTNCLYIVREGETVESIANDLLRDPWLAPLIFEKNRKHVLPSEDYGVHPLKAGSTIELPTASEREKFYASRRKD